MGFELRFGRLEELWRASKIEISFLISWEELFRSTRLSDFLLLETCCEAGNELLILWESRKIDTPSRFEALGVIILNLISLKSCELFFVACALFLTPSGWSIGLGGDVSMPLDFLNVVPEIGGSTATSGSICRTPISWKKMISQSATRAAQTLDAPSTCQEMN